jgi:hypothetical protein
LGDPKRLLAECPDPKVQQFLRRGEPATDATTQTSQRTQA